MHTPSLTFDYLFTLPKMLLDIPSFLFRNHEKQKTKKKPQWLEAVSGFKEVSCDPAAALVLKTAREGGKGKEFSYVLMSSWSWETSEDTQAHGGEGRTQQLGNLHSTSYHEWYLSKLCGNLKTVIIQNDPSLRDQHFICQCAQTRNL